METDIYTQKLNYEIELRARAEARARARKRIMQDVYWINLHNLEEMYDLTVHVSKNRKEALICLMAIIKLKHNFGIKNSNSAYIKYLAESFSNDRPLSVDQFLETVRNLNCLTAIELCTDKYYLKSLWKKGAHYIQQCLNSTEQELLTLIFNAIEEAAEGSDDESDKEDAREQMHSPLSACPSMTIYHLIQYGQEFSRAEKKLDKSPHSEEASTLYSLALLNFIEAAQLVPEELKKPIYIALLGDANPQELDTMEELPGMKSQPLFLHDYPPFQAVHGSAERSKMAIQKSIDQNLENHFFIQELIKNCMEAGATEIYITTQRAQGKLGIGIRDNGIGMDAIGTDALIITSKSTKENQNHGVGLECDKLTERVCTLS